MKGVGLGGKRYIDIPGFRGYVTARLNPYRREEKRLAREAMWQKKKKKELDRSKGNVTVVRSTPPAIPESGRVAQARRLEETWNDSEEKRKRNRLETKIRSNRNMKKRLVSKFGSIQAAISATLKEQEPIA